MAAKRAPLEQGGVSDFSGGPNIRDAASKLEKNESVGSWNCTYDERGDVASRLGYVQDNATPFTGGLVRNQFWSQILAQKITQAGKDLHLGTTNTSRKTFTTTELVTFAEMNSKIVACHPTDGLFTSTDGVTWTAVADPDAPKGVCVEVWQNKLWVGKTDGSVAWSAAGDPATWTATDFNKLWEKDQQGVVALHVGSGQDIQGRPGLLAYKQESMYRVNDSTTGAYETIDSTIGAAGPLAVVGVGAKVFTLCKRGIFWWAEGQIGAVNASDRFLPLWTSQTNLAQQSLWCAGRKGNRAVFSLTRDGSTANDLALEYHPDQGWISPGSNAMSCYATSTGTTEVLYGGSPSVSGRCYQMDSGGTDDGSAITGWFQTRWFELADGFKAQVWQIRMQGRGSGTVTYRTDYASSGGTTKPFNFDSTVQTWDSGLTWDSGITWSVPSYQSTVPVYSVGVCRQLSLLFDFTVSTTADAPQVLGTGTAPSVGAFGLFGLTWLYVQLGLA